MDRMRGMFLLVSLMLFSTSMRCINLGETFDVHMGKYTNEWFKPCITNTSPGPWVADSKYAYYLSRSLFENYSIEREEHQTEFKVPKIIHQIWLGSAVPQKYASWLATWHKHHPDWTIIMWMDHDMQNLNLVNKDLFKRVHNYGEKADILRLELINMFGGLYIDTDYECLQPFDKFNLCNSFYICSVGVGICGIGVNNGLIGASQGHPLIQKLVHSMKSAANKPGLTERTGPIYVTRTFFENVAQFQKDVVMYPAPYLASHPQCDRNNKEHYAIHWFDASWLRPQGLREKIPHDPTLEIGLTPLYFEKKSKSTVMSPFLGLRYNDCAEIFSRLNNRTIIELGACSFLIDAKMDLGDLKYTGISPVKFLALDQRLLHNNRTNRVYWWRNWLREEIPHCGLLLIGDSLEYLPYEDCLAVLQKMAGSNPEFFIIAHDTSQKNNETKLGKARSLNMCKAPFNFPQPDKIITVGKKRYGVWNNNRLK